MFLRDAARIASGTFEGVPSLLLIKSGSFKQSGSLIKNWSHVARWISALGLLNGAALPCQADALGARDARTMAMGGAVVAVGSPHEGPLYNPALLALHRGDEEATSDGLMGLPNLTGVYSDSVRKAYDLARDDVSSDLSRLINDFNNRTNNTAEDAEAIAEVADDLLGAAETFRDVPILGDFAAGWVIAEPSHWQGGGFFLRSRVYAEGIAAITDTDLDRVRAVSEGLRFIATQGEEGSAQPELLDANGNLIDITTELTSSASATVTTLIETGVSFSKVVTVFGQRVALGASPKWASWRVDRAIIRLRNSDLLRQAGDASNQERVNVDVGAALQWGDGWRFGASVMNAIPYRLSFGEVDLPVNPVGTLGIGQITPTWRWGVDTQFASASIPGSDLDSHWVSAGGEWRPHRSIQLRAGVRQDLEGTNDTRFSLGLGFYAGNVSVDLARMWNESGDGLALQIGFAL